MTYYEILEISPDANETEIKKAFRTLAKRYHPDVSKEPDAETHFKLLYIAYDILQDPYKRKLYDELQHLKSSAEEEHDTSFNQWHNNANTHAGRYSRMKYEEFDNTFLSKIVFHTNQTIAFLFCFGLLVLGMVTFGLCFIFFKHRYFNGAYVLGTGSIIAGSLFLFYGFKGLIGVFSSWQGKLEN